MKKTTKMNIGLSLSRNFDKVTLEMLDEPIESSNEQEFIQEIQMRYTLLRTEVLNEFKNIQK